MKSESLLRKIIHFDISPNCVSDAQGQESAREKMNFVKKKIPLSLLVNLMLMYSMCDNVSMHNQCIIKAVTPNKMVKVDDF